ncbi:2OG-Fe(II) oxygenase [Helicobacter baculiformis]|uniref:2OG-Fe(II) oxygenase n=1 Tax=Helicobacter baculiformis TaxID=427351 RepID=A0ABV7ZKY0_9HELI|nr:2OG-Fe(II) oxygenase [Helicobacter baculiformis]
MAYYESMENENIRRSYYENANRNNLLIKEITFPYISPIDYIISYLDVVWNQGCKRAVFEDYKTFSGLIRVLNEKSDIEPHQDVFRRDNYQLWQNLPIKEQIAFNCFLSVADEGGEMEIWDFKLSDEEYRRLQHKDEKLRYGLDRNKVFSKKIEHRPKLGEIVLFNAGYLHAVKKVKRGNRLSMSSFIGIIDGSGAGVKYL